METHDFNSSNLASGTYDPDIAEMTLTFTSGGVYKYANVGWTDWEGLINAPSAGRYFAQYIRNVFPAERV